MSRRVVSVSGNEIFWSSGTWLMFLAQGVILVAIFGLYLYMGQKEKAAAGKTAARKS